MNRILFSIIASAFIFFCFSCGGSKNEHVDVDLTSPVVSNSTEQLVEQDLLVDARDGKKYKITKIGAQVWMAENLSYNAKNSKCYNDETANCKKYGRLYGWDIVNGKQNICPDGWRLPTSADWNSLVNHTGGEKNAGTKLKAKSGWNNFEKTSGNGTDNYGFAALPGGHCSQDGKFNYAGDLGLWWSNNLKGYSEFASNWYINTRGNAKNNDFFDAQESFFSSIRCIKKD